jgi:catechol 2,3-dioxygenase-like lactoylglutathione lyase family enzyme
MITHINTVAVYVDDQQKSLEFWTDTMGFQVRGKEQLGGPMLSGWRWVRRTVRPTWSVPQVYDGQLGRAKTIHCLRLR